MLTLQILYIVLNTVKHTKDSVLSCCCDFRSKFCSERVSSHRCYLSYSCLHRNTPEQASQVYWWYGFIPKAFCCPSAPRAPSTSFYLLWSTQLCPSCVNENLLYLQLFFLTGAKGCPILHCLVCCVVKQVQERCDVLCFGYIPPLWPGSILPSLYTDGNTKYGTAEKRTQWLPNTPKI